MKILISCLVLDLSGTPTYTVTLYHELERRGHEVTVYSPSAGKLANGLRVIRYLRGQPAPDVILAQMNICAEALRGVFPSVPIIFSAHGVLPPTEQAAGCFINHYTAINEDVRANLISQGVEAERVEILRDFVDTARFSQTRPVSDKPKKLLFISNFKKWRTYSVIEHACHRMGLEFKAIGSPYGRSYTVEKDINEADLVISVGRGVLEAMSCERPVISFDQMRGDGYLTPEVYLESRTRNFAGEHARFSFDELGLLAEMEKYRREDGAVNRGLVLESHDSIKGVNQLLDMIWQVAGI